MNFCVQEGRDDNHNKPSAGPHFNQDSSSLAALEALQREYLPVGRGSPAPRHTSPPRLASPPRYNAGQDSQHINHSFEEQFKDVSLN